MLYAHTRGVYTHVLSRGKLPITTGYVVCAYSVVTVPFLRDIHVEHMQSIIIRKSGSEYTKLIRK